MADLGFPRGGGANSPGGRQHTILLNFPKNCMKLKEFGPGGGGRPKFYYVDPPLHRLQRYEDSLQKSQFIKENNQASQYWGSISPRHLSLSLKSKFSMRSSLFHFRGGE